MNIVIRAVGRGFGQEMKTPSYDRSLLKAFSMQSWTGLLIMLVRQFSNSGMQADFSQQRKQLRRIETSSYQGTATDKQRSLVARRVAGLSALIILAGLCQPLSAQIGTANLSGTVIDSTGAVIPDAQVVLKSVTENASRRTTTDAVGRYQ